MSARIEIDLDAFRHNVRTLAALAAPARTMLAVKADGYGHGMLPIARASLESGADSLAVLDVPAALAIRAAGIDAQVFAWLHGQETDFRAGIEAGVDLGVSSLTELRRIADAGVASVHLKIDTGLHRNGASPEDWPELVRATLDLQEAGRVRLAGLWSHLADASPDDDAAALAEFRAAIAVAAGIGVPMAGPDRPLLHLAASSAGIRMPEARFDLVRFGIAAYGVSPFDDVDARGLGMRAPMTVTAEIVRRHGDYAVLGIGSADGLPPTATPDAPSGQGAEVLLGDRRAGVFVIHVDETFVGATRHDQVGDVAVIYGPGDHGEPTAEDWARWAGTIGDEILARASTRIPRVYLNE